MQIKIIFLKVIKTVIIRFYFKNVEKNLLSFFTDIDNRKFIKYLLRSKERIK